MYRELWDKTDQLFEDCFALLAQGRRIFLALEIGERHDELNNVKFEFTILFLHLASLVFCPGKKISDLFYSDD